MSQERHTLDAHGMCSCGRTKGQHSSQRGDWYYLTPEQAAYVDELPLDVTPSRPASTTVPGSRLRRRAR
jgi:hypothetical protein